MRTFLLPGLLHFVLFIMFLPQYSALKCMSTGLRSQVQILKVVLTGREVIVQLQCRKRWTKNPQKKGIFRSNGCFSAKFCLCASPCFLAEV